MTVSDSEKPVLWSGGSEKNQLFTAYVQTDKKKKKKVKERIVLREFTSELFTHARSRAVHWSTALSKMLCAWDASVTLRCRARVIRHFTSEQNKVSKSKVVEKVMPVPDNICQKL